MNVSISPSWLDHLQGAPLTPWWPKLELKIWPHLAESIESEIMDIFWFSRCLNDHIDLHNMIELYESGTTTSIVAKNRTKNLSQPFKELQGSNSEFMLITPKSILKSIWRGLVWQVCIWCSSWMLKMLFSQLFEELQGSNSEFMLITPKSNIGTYFKSNMSRFGLVGFPMAPILNFLKGNISAVRRAIE